MWKDTCKGSVLGCHFRRVSFLCSLAALSERLLSALTAWRSSSGSSTAAEMPCTMQHALQRQLRIEATEDWKTPLSREFKEASGLLIARASEVSTQAYGEELDFIPQCSAAARHAA